MLVEILRRLQRELRPLRAPTIHGSHPSALIVRHIPSCLECDNREREQRLVLMLFSHSWLPLYSSNKNTGFEPN